MNWITSWPSVIVGCAGFTACIVGLLVRTRKTKSRRYKIINPSEIRRIEIRDMDEVVRYTITPAGAEYLAKEKAAARGNDTDNGKR